jgi:pyrroline-5-carboxylate reductase
MITKTIGFVGAGNMAGALIDGLLHSGLVEPSRLIASDVRQERLQELREKSHIQTTSDNHHLIRESQVIVLSVKPQVLDRVLKAVATDMQPDTLVISIAAGVSINSIESRLPPGARVVRTMPNTPAIVLAGATAISAGTHATEADLAISCQLFEAVGRVTVLEENLLDAVTGLSGSGPAYIMVMIEAMADGGVKMGLHRQTALMLAAQTVFGAAKLLLETKAHPGQIKDMVASPAGTTIAGLHTLEGGGVRKTLIDAVEAATKRSIELGIEMSKK